MSTRPRTERLIALSLAGLALVACSRDEDLGEASDAAAQVHRVAGVAVSSVTLTKVAQTALAIQTERVREARQVVGGAATTFQVIPYSAVLYDSTGHTWTFTLTGPRSYRRAPVSLDHVADDLAYLRQSLDPTTTVVTVGAAELLGAEEGVGGE